MSRGYQILLKVGLSPSKKKIICFNDSPSKMMRNAFYFILKALFLLKIFKFLYWLIEHEEKTTWLERQAWFWNLWRHSLVNKESQHTYCSISHELKSTRQWNLVIPREIFFFKNYAENEVGKLVPDHFLFFLKAFY